MFKKVEIVYDNGYTLLIDKSISKAPLLFMEWVATFPTRNQPIHKILDCSLFFKITLKGAKNDTYVDAMNYINNNL